MKKRIRRRILTAVLSLIMLLTLLPAAALAADETGGTTTSSGIELSKTVTLTDDGTYTIDLEAYATGTTTTTTKTSSTPLDIVLVIDQSGSMAYNDSGSNTNTESDRRYYKLKAAVTSFAETIAANAKSTGADHRIAIAGYGKNGTTTTTSITGAYISSGSNQTYWVNTGLFIDGTLKNYGSNSQNSSTQLTSTDYQSALVSAYNETTDGVTASITTAISNFAAYGGTYTEYGLLMAQNVFANNSATYTYTDENGDTQNGTRKRIVILFTDGATDSDKSTVLSYSNTLKSTYNATVYCVGFGSSLDSDFLSYVSSNYGSDTSYTSGYWGGYSGTSSGTTKYSMTATNSSELNNIFQTITEDVSQDSTTVTLDANSVMKDIMGDGFTLTDASTVTIKTVAGTSDGTTVTWGDETTNSASYTISDDKTTVSVTGFNYADKYISSGHAGEKICVTITGVLPTTNVTTDEAVNTNAATSGIYATADATEAAATFEQPQTIITKKLYVLDYAKTATLTGLDQDTSVTGIVDGYKKVTSDDQTLTQSYGKSAVSGTNLTYTPTTTNWNSYDSLYVFGQTTNSTVTALEANSTGYLWSKVSVIPANNVYYEDDFITNESTGTVGIVYTGSWSTVGESSGNTETANNDTYGWVVSLKDDATYSDGSSTASGSAGATATFTFTGTGVDIYSRTDMVSGTVIVQVKSTTTNKSVTYVCDDLSTSGTYYQIPTVCFNALDYTAKNGMGYDTYTVTITVATNSSTSGETYTYYLDGVRVYNPLGETVTGDAYEAYEADNELNAVFTEVRSILIDKETFTANYDGAGGVVFIDDLDSDTETTDSTSDIGTYASYGPENEVYLATGQSIAFKVGDGDNYYLGLKSADGKGTEATVTDGSTTKELTIGHTTDLYYEITPTSDGYIMVKNTGSNLLSITKLRSTSATSAASGIALLSADEVDEIMVYAASFDSLQSVASTETGVEEDSFVDTEIDTETDVNTETDDLIEELDEDDIEIENPTEDTKEEQEEASSSQSSFSNLFNTIRNWFNGRR